jgi:hypothetical protein
MKKDGFIQPNIEKEDEQKKFKELNLNLIRIILSILSGGGRL